MARLLKLRVTPIARRVLSVLVLLGVCAASLPLPVPVVAAVMKDRSIPFPCQDHPCGCHDAKQCWTTCGCMSMEEKLRWAESRGFSPPSYVDTKAGIKRSCCTNQGAKCCSRTPSACRDHKGDQCRQISRTSKQPTMSQKAGAQHIVLLTSYIAKCNGVDNLVASLPWSIVSKPMILQSVSRQPGWRWLNVDELSLSALPDPPIPPPRLVAFLDA